MANVHCVFLKFCVFCLIFVQLSQSNQINSEQYQYNLDNSHNLKHLGNAEFQSFRVKRDVNEPPKTVASSVSTPTASTTTSTPSDKPTKVDTPTVATTPHLLGVNGTGQRKDIAPVGATKLTSVSAPLNSSDNKTATINKSLGAAVQPAKQPDGGALDLIEKEIGDIVDVDEPEELINSTIYKQITNVTTKVDFFQYYNSTLFVDKAKSDEYWNEKKDFVVSNILSRSHRRAITVQLKFDFPFYGHLVRNVTAATGGFLYTGEYVHSWLAATQYIAPLMANFDTTIANVSTVKYADNGTAFTVIWEKVPLQDGNADKSPLFTFSVTLFNTGDITFAYRNIPFAIESIKDEKHPVKIGLSDAYIIDKTIYFARRKTIYEYHRVNFNGQDITNDTIIQLKALPTCLEHHDCASCLDANLEAFNCTWCPALNRCSTGTDRKRQEWIQNGCEKSQLRDTKVCPALGTKGNNYSSQSANTPTTTNQNEQWISSSEEISKNGSKSSKEVKKSALPHIDNDQPKGNHASFFAGILLPIVVMISLVMWVFYAYRNPHTKSGQLLIQYRPSQWTWRRGEARYTAATIHM